MIQSSKKLSRRDKMELANRFSGIDVTPEQQRDQILNCLCSIVFNNQTIRCLDFIDIDSSTNLFEIIGDTFKEYLYFNYKYLIAPDIETSQFTLDLHDQIISSELPQYILFVDYSDTLIERKFLNVWSRLSKIDPKKIVKVVFISRVLNVNQHPENKIDQIETALTELMVDKHNIRQITLIDPVKINILEVIKRFQSKYEVFDFRYFFYSKLCKHIDWVTSISGSSPTIKPTWQLKHRPGTTDWHNAWLSIHNAKHNKFLCVLDNAKMSKRFLNQERYFLENFLKQRQFLSPNVKFLKIIRPDLEL